MADMDGFLRALNLMSGTAGTPQQQQVPRGNQQQPVTGNRAGAPNFGGEELTCLIGITAPNNPPVNWVTETINGEQVSYDPLVFRRSAGGDRVAKALAYCGPTFGTVQQPIGLSDYSYMFAKSSVQKVNLDRWDVSKVKNLEGMFSTCMNLSELRLNSWKVGKCRSMSRMLENCLNLNVLQISKWEPDNLEDIDDMFKAVDMSLIPEWYNDWC
ncbi:MAG: BspA family leucine-rich repeat surface protein [Roseburia sp.]|nr:BspA family leucine-rich repeat surface protein [Roseburia sp.]